MAVFSKWFGSTQNTEGASSSTQKPNKCPSAVDRSHLQSFVRRQFLPGLQRHCAVTNGSVLLITVAFENAILDNSETPKIVADKVHTIASILNSAKDLQELPTSLRQLLHLDLTSFSAQARWGGLFRLEVNLLAEIVVSECMRVKSDRHNAYLTMARHHENIDADTQNFLEQQDAIDLQKYSNASAVTGQKPWLKQAHKMMAAQMEEYFLLTSDARRRYVERESAIKLKTLRREYFETNQDRLPADLANEALVKCATEISASVSQHEDRKIKLLDVGSCHDAFRSLLEDHEVVALDLKPAVSSCYVADFLQIDAHAPDHVGFVTEKCGAGTGNDSKKLISIPSHHFDVLVMSLVLSYLPSAAQRYEIISHARKFLKTGGLLSLLIAKSVAAKRTRDVVLENWRRAIEGLGFVLEHGFDDSHKSGISVTFRAVEVKVTTERHDELLMRTSAEMCQDRLTNESMGNYEVD